MTLRLQFNYDCVRPSFQCVAPKEAGESVLRIVDQRVNMIEPIKTRVSGELSVVLRILPPHLKFQARPDATMSFYSRERQCELDDH